MRSFMRGGCVALIGAAALLLPGCVGENRPGTLPPTPGATKTYQVYIADYGTNDVSVADASNVVVKRIPVGKAPVAVAIEPMDLVTGAPPKHAFVVNSADNTVTVINTADGSIAATIPVGPSPSAIAYASTQAGNGLMLVTNGDGTVSQIQTSSLTVTATFKFGCNIVSLLGTVSDFWALCDNKTAYDFNLDTNKIVGSIPIKGTPIGAGEEANNTLLVSADGTIQPVHPDNFGGYVQLPAVNTGIVAQHAMDTGEDFAFVNTTAGTITMYNAIGFAPMQTLPVGKSPTMVTGLLFGIKSFFFVPNKGSDNVSVFQGTDIAALTLSSQITLAPGSQPVSAATWSFWTTGTPTPGPTATPSVTPTPGVTATPAGTPTPSVSANHLYIANFSGNVTQYASPFSNASAPSTTFADTTPVGGPVGVAASSSYVFTTHIQGNVNAYAQPVNGSSTPTAAFGGSAFGFLAFDPQGNLWATSQNSSVVEYVPPFTNSTTEAKSLTNGFTSSYGIAFDTSGNMYVTNSDASANIVVYPPPYTTLGNKYAITTPNARLHGLAVCGSQLLVADTRNGLIYIFALPLTTNIPSDAFTATAPLGVTCDAGNTLYVTSQGTNQIQTFNPPFNSGSRPATTITNGVNQAYGIAIGQ